MSVAIYDQAAVRVNGRYVTQQTSVTVSFQAGDQIVYLLGGGTGKTFALSPDSRLLVVQWSMAVPTKDTRDLEFIRQFLDCELVKLGVDMLGSGEALSSTGFLREPQLNGSVGGSLSYTCSFVGDPTSFSF